MIHSRYYSSMPNYMEVLRKTTKKLSQDKLVFRPKFEPSPSPTRSKILTVWLQCLVRKY